MKQQISRKEVIIMVITAILVGILVGGWGVEKYVMPNLIEDFELCKYFLNESLKLNNQCLFMYARDCLNLSEEILNYTFAYERL